MKQYKKVRLYTLAEMRSLYAVGGKKPIEKEWPEYAVGDDLYLDLATSIGALTDSITIPGTYDHAVPQSWWEQNRPVGLNNAIWWYPPSGEEGHIFGKPLTLREMIKMLRKEYREAKNAALINAAETVIRFAREFVIDRIESTNDSFSEEELQSCNILEEYLRKHFHLD